MTITPCKKDPELKQRIEEFAEVLKTKAHLLADFGLSEKDFYNSGLFRGTIERIRGQFSATMREKREFVRRILSFMEDQKFITSFESSGSRNRYDYTVELPSGKIAVIELKGGLDGNNTNIFERPAHANELIVWSVSTNQGGDPRRNVWSGLHTRLSAEMISNNKRVDGLIVWDWVCGTLGRKCPKVDQNPSRKTIVAQFELPPPCIYVLPATIPEVRNNATPTAQALGNVEILDAFHRCFKGSPDEVNYVDFEVAYRENDTIRRTIVRRGGVVVQQSEFTPIQRR
ncbi:MAG: hypothetical protein FJX45_16145 [Alphaproteobacteria bacterium]|nr:hypothetical protein [Alphaproteobacteria bacterium]MBM3652981.1 hypothetical protein [Alphaproteobacteria bacterium]